MTLIDKLKQTVAEWMSNAQEEVKVETPAETAEVAPTEMSAEVAPEVEAAPVAEATDMEQRIADLESLVATIIEKMDGMMKSDVAAQAMSAVEQIRKDVEEMKGEVTKMGAQPAPAPTKTKKVEMKAQKPAVASLLARLNSKN